MYICVSTTNVFFPSAESMNQIPKPQWTVSWLCNFEAEAKYMHLSFWWILKEILQTTCIECCASLLTIQCSRGDFRVHGLCSCTTASNHCIASLLCHTFHVDHILKSPWLNSSTMTRLIEAFKSESNTSHSWPVSVHKLNWSDFSGLLEHSLCQLLS